MKTLFFLPNFRKTLLFLPQLQNWAASFNFSNRVFYLTRVVLKAAFATINSDFATVMVVLYFFFFNYFGWNL